MTCVVCGESRPPVGTIPIKIKRIPRGQKAGMALVSANSAAFESYGLDAISGAPICLKCGEGFSKAANALIEADDTHLTIGPTVYIFWTTQRSKAQRGAVEFQPARLLGRPTPEQFAALAALDVSDATLHAAAFSASGARVVVRDYLMTGVGQARQNLACYFTIQQLVGPDGSDSKPISLFALAASVVRDANRDLPAEVTKILVHTALEGGPLPTWLLYQAVKRNRVEQRVTRPRAALVKMVLLSQHDWTVGRAPDGRMSHLTSKDPILEQPRKRQAYHCGRLLAMIERTQRAALGFPKATIAGRFFATASTAPAAVFGRLMRLNGSHLEKLRKEWPNAYAALHARIEEITHPHLPGFPQTLNLDEQGLFSLGYYHQHAHDRGEASARRRAREAGKKSA
jgi:CRISPR-associated protein Csd1